MNDELNANNIMEEVDVNDLFPSENDVSTKIEQPVKEVEPTVQTTETKENEPIEVESINPEDLFDNTKEQPESVDRGKITKEGENITSSAASSDKNLYLNLASVLKEDGVFPNLGDEDLNTITSPEKFREMIDNQVSSELSDRQKRIEMALNSDIKPDVITKYENTIGWLNDVKEEDLEAEGEEYEEARKKLIYQDYLNRGFSKERAEKMTNKSVEDGTDIEDSKDALKSTKDFYETKYNELLANAKKEEEAEIQKQKDKYEELKKSILEDDKCFGVINPDKNTRKMILDTFSKPVYKDPETGMQYTKLQKYQKDNKIEFAKNLALVFTLTKGFTDFGGLVKGTVKKEVNENLKNLENILNTTSRNPEGSLKFTSGVDGEEKPNKKIKYTIDTNNL